MDRRKKEPDAIPLETLLDYPGFERNLKIEIRSAVADPKLVEALIDMTLHAALTGSRKQQFAARKPRPKKSKTQRSATIDAMRLWRSGDSTLADFLDACGVDSVEDVCIKLAPVHGVKRFIVECLEVDADPQSVARSTLEEWWAKSKPTTD